jgi:hypothetical protein
MNVTLQMSMRGEDKVVVVYISPNIRDELIGHY